MDTGLFTIYATVIPFYADTFIPILARIFKSLVHIHPDELQLAKNALKSSIHMNLEMRAVMMEDIGRQLVLAGKVGTAQEFGKMVDSISADDLRNVLKACLRTKLTFVAYGEVSGLPSYDDVAKFFK